MQRHKGSMPEVSRPPATVFNLGLFESLNEEYRSQPLVPRIRGLEPNAVRKNGQRRAHALEHRFDLAGKSILEIGCGRGEVLAALAKTARQCTGVDVKTRPLWRKFTGPKVRLVQTDLTQDAALAGERFDFIFSLAAWEHIRHPYAMLERAVGLLRPGGEMYLNANLYRGPKASHRYREVFFPWPHLLFEDEIFEQFYLKHHGKLGRASWVNRLTAAHYLLYFDILGLERLDISYKLTPIDEDFYARFEDRLSRYPRFDLERDFIEAYLRQPERDN